MQWWCSAQGQPWDWTWQPYVGVWLFVALIAAGYVALRRRYPPTEPDNGDGRRGAAYFVTGLLLLWAALDWPLGALGASYLASAHVTQFLLAGIIAPGLMLLGIPRGAFGVIERRPTLHAFLADLTHPVPAFLIFNVGMTVTHWPGVVDAAMATQAGAFTLDMAWVLCGVIFWWPLLAPIPARPGFHPLLKIGYLAFNGILIRPPFAMMLFSEYPIYATYELAPPFPGTSPLHDQQLAGAIMKVVTAWIMGVAAFMIFREWRRADSLLEEGSAARERPV